MNVPEEYAAQYWADMDTELANWFDEDPVEESLRDDDISRSSQ
jgi:hypothetical protein